MKKNIYRLTALIFLAWVLGNAILGNRKIQWDNPCLLGFGAMAVVFMIAPWRWFIRHRPHAQPATKPAGEPEEGEIAHLEREVTHLQREAAHHRAEHAWEKTKELLKWLFGHEEKKEEEGKARGFDWGTFLVFAAVITGLIFLAERYGLLGKGQPYFLLWDKVIPKNSSVRGYLTLEGAEARRISGSATGFRQLVVKQQSGDFTRACSLLEDETTCWWFRTDELQPSSPSPTPRPTLPGPTSTPQRAMY